MRKQEPCWEQASYSIPTGIRRDQIKHAIEVSGASERDVKFTVEPHQFRAPSIDQGDQRNTITVMYITELNKPHTLRYRFHAELRNGFASLIITVTLPFTN